MLLVTIEFENGSTCERQCMSQSYLGQCIDEMLFFMDDMPIKNLSVVITPVVTVH
jgi:hypothetical protein